MKVQCLTCYFEKDDDNDGLMLPSWCGNCNKMRYFQYIATSVVVLTCDKSYYDVNKVKFIDISESMLGEDIITYECPKCNETHKSFILG